MAFGRRQITGILGIVLAVAGGVAWFYGQNILGVIAWAAAFLVVLKLNKKKRK